MTADPEASWIAKLIGSWQLWLATVSAAIYSLGYVKALALLAGLGTIAVPTEVFAGSSIFIWGLIALIGAIPLPAIVFFVCYMISALPRRLIARAPLRTVRAFIQDVLLGLLIGLVVLVGFSLLKNNEIGSFLFQVFDFVPWNITFISAPASPRQFGIVYSVLLGLVATICLHDFSMARYTRPLIAGIGIVFASAVGSVIQDYYIGYYNPKLLRQRPVMFGTLVTAGPIQDPVPKAGENPTEHVYTRGVLVSKKDGFVFFVPERNDTGLSTTSEAMTRFVLVPQNRVIAFIEK